jgi:hypothetical protein
LIQDGVELIPPILTRADFVRTHADNPKCKVEYSRPWSTSTDGLQVVDWTTDKSYLALRSMQSNGYLIAWERMYHAS